MSRKITRYNDEFKSQIVKLYNSGKPVGELSKEYKLALSTIHGWVKLQNNFGSFRLKDSLSVEQKELIELRKRNKQLEMELDILKQAALIIGRKSK